ncbi:MAG: Lrp/AsnC family transcriptional regulator [Rhodocyclales bacterium]|nr:Lrp/AsnC family transcriptional regulator [Rhodocyclales bacterium]
MDTLLSFVNRWQRGFPLVPSPFAAIAAREGTSEAEVIEAFAAARKAGWMARLGPVWAPRRFGWSTLAAARVPPEKLDAVAECVSIFPEVNHNYAREDEWNLWFVLTSPSEARGRAVLVAIEQALQVPVIALPLRTEFFVDLGFDLTGEEKRAPTKAEVPSPVSLSAELEPSVRELSAGLPLVPRPYAAVGERVGCSEVEVIAQLERWIGAGVVRRIGAVVRHRRLGYRANAMCVWDVPDDAVRQAGERLAREPAVSLCYERFRALPHWPYNLYAMIHGRDRETVSRERHRLGVELGLDRWPHRVLFSTKEYKQTGADYTGRE